MNLTKRPERLSFIASVLGFILAIAAYQISRRTSTAMMVPVLIASITTALSGFLTGIRMKLNRQVVEDALEAKTYKKTRASEELFDEDEDHLLMSRKTFNHYQKYVIPFAAAIGAFAMIWLSLRNWNRPIGEVTLVPSDFLPLGILAIICSCASLLYGAFFNGASRDNGNRWLRLPSGWLLLTSLMFFVNGLYFFLCSSMGRYSNPMLRLQSLTGVESILGRIWSVVIFLLGLELILVFIVEFYRPRNAREEDRAIFESRLLGLFTQPGGIAHNIAMTLDYQFGFKVSDAWFYRFLERGLLPSVVISVLLLWTMTCIQTISSDEQGIRLRFGEVINKEAPIGPGVYFKLPWPFEEISVMSVDKIQRVPLGYSENMELTSDIILWTKQHRAMETKFIAAGAEENHRASSRTGIAEESERIPSSASLITASIPAYFKVVNLYDYRFRHSNTNELLQNIGTRVLIEYFSTTDFNEAMMSFDNGAEIVRQRMQKIADEQQLGVRIMFIGFQGVHPPIDLGEAFESVAKAAQDKEKEVLIARRRAFEEEANAKITSIQKVWEALKYKLEKEKVQQAQSEFFEARLVSYEASPEIFILRNYLEMLANNMQETRKYILALPEASKVLIFNLEERFNPVGIFSN